MSDLRKAAEMALGALNYHFDNEDDYLNWRYPLVLEAKQALRQALAEESLQHMTTNAEELGLYDLELIGKSYEALRCDVDALKDKP
jgi:AcrR family transcriptional regulator